MNTPTNENIDTVQEYLINEFNTDEISCSQSSSGIEIKLNDRNCKEQLNELVEQNNVRFDRPNPQGNGSFRLENGHPYALIIQE